MNRYYDKDGSPISLYDWAAKFEDFTYKRVDETTLPDGTRVSTVWLGLNHQYGDGPPLIFETMMFSTNEDDEDMARYSTLPEAKAGHATMVARWQTIKQETP